MAGGREKALNVKAFTTHKSNVAIAGEVGGKTEI